MSVVLTGLVCFGVVGFIITVESFLERKSSALRTTVKGVVAIGIALGLQFAHADTYVQDNDHSLQTTLEKREISKGDAVRVAAKDPKAVIIDCKFVKLSEKGTLTGQSK